MFRDRQSRPRRVSGDVRGLDRDTEGDTSYRGYVAVGSSPSRRSGSRGPSSSSTSDSSPSSVPTEPRGASSGPGRGGSVRVVGWTYLADRGPRGSILHSRRTGCRWCTGHRGPSVHPSTHPVTGPTTGGPRPATGRRHKTGVGLSGFGCPQGIRVTYSIPFKCHTHPHSHLCQMVHKTVLTPHPSDCPILRVKILRKEGL